MAVLSGSKVAKLGIVEPIESSQIQPASIDVRLDSDFIWFPAALDAIDPALGGAPYCRYENQTQFTMAPGQLVLASTYEIVRIPNNLVARFEGKSSLGRIGIMTHVTAGFIDPGFEGQITIELCNVSPNTIILWPGMKIGQICVEEMADVGHVYGESIGSTYQGQRGPTPYKVSKNFTKGLPQ